MNLLEKRNTNATTVVVPKGTNYRTAQHIAENARPVAKRDNFASVCLSKRSDDVEAVTSELDFDSDSLDDEYAFSIEEVGMIKEKGTQLIATLSFTDENTNFSTEIDCH